MTAEREIEMTLDEALAGAAALAERGMLREAEGLARGVLMHDPTHFEAASRLGAVLMEQGKIHEALYVFWRQRKAHPRHPTALSNYALTLGELGHPEEALPDLERAVHFAQKIGASDRHKALYLNNLGNTLLKLERFPAAAAALDRCVALDSTSAMHHYNRGIALLKLNRRAEAIAALTSAGTIDPDHHDAFYNRAMGRLALGDIRGFEDYEHRLLTTSVMKPNLGFPAEKKWTGQDLAGKTLLVCGEQGLGDTIQYMRFVPALTHMADKVLLAVQGAIRPMVEATLPAVTVISGKAEIPNDAYDYWVAAMSLPLWLGYEDWDELPEPWAPAAAVSNERITRVVDVLRPAEDRPNVGVVWAGNWLHKNDGHRSIALATFKALFDAPCHFVSLQQLRGEDKPAVAELENCGQVVSLDPKDFRDTAAAILSLDLVVTVDTAVAHLSASLGVPTWILLPVQDLDWRWQLERRDSPWYPAARLIRQRKAGDWKSIIAEVRDELAARHCARHRAAA